MMDTEEWVHFPSLSQAVQQRDPDPVTEPRSAPASNPAPVPAPVHDPAPAPVQKQSGRRQPPGVEGTIDRGIHHYARGELKQSLSAFMGGLATQRGNLLDDDNPLVAHSMNNIGTVLLARGELDGALNCLKEALRLERKAGPAMDDTMGNTLHNLGNVLAAKATRQRETGETGLASSDSLFDDALRFYKMALRARQDRVHSDPLFADTLHNIAQVLVSKGELDKALAAFREALRITREVRGSNHVYVADTLERIGYLHLDRGENEHAMAAFVEVLNLTKAALGDDHRDVATSLYNIAACHEVKGELDDAWDVYEMAIDGFGRSSVPDNDPSVHTVRERVSGIKRRLMSDTVSV